MFYKFSRGSDWIKVSDGESEVKWSCNKGNKDMNILNELKSGYHPIRKAVLVYDDYKSDIYVQVNKFASLVRLGYSHHSNDFPNGKKVLVVKSERGTHSGRVQVKRGGKVFIRTQRLGRKEKGSIKEIKSSLDPDNLVKIESIEEVTDLNVVGGIHENETFICKFKDDSHSIQKVMDRGDIVGEIGCYKTAKICNWDIVPETIQVNYGKGMGSSQKWIEDSDEPMDSFNEFGIELNESHMKDLSQIFCMDMVTGNFDRHGGNIQIDKNGKCWAIDNEAIGKFHNAELHMESLDEYCKNGKGFPVPMLHVLGDSFGNDPKMYQKFKHHVMKSIGEIIDHKDEIIKYWSQHNESKLTNTGVPIKEGIKNIEKNIKYLEDYRGKQND